MPSSPSARLRAYLPTLSLRAQPDAVAPARRCLRGSCLWVDMSGFTALTERLSARGPEGIERLSAGLNQFYAAVVAAVRAAGGDVLFFAGDGALCLWEATEEALEATSTWLAASAALLLREDVLRFAREDFHFELRQVIVTGELALDTVGGQKGHWLDVVTGEPLKALAALSRACSAGQVFLSESAARELAGRAIFASPTATDGAALLSLIEERCPSSASARRAVAAGTAIPGVARTKVPGFLSTELGQRASPRSELRRVSVTFLHCAAPATPRLDELHAFAELVQSMSSRHHGALCQLVQDDKGLTAVVSFGLPGQARAEDGVRAVRFALDVSKQAALLGSSVRVGVARGPAFCGVLGGENRVQYCVLGDAVNRAARLAELAADGPLFDDQTFQSASRRVALARYGTLPIKGVAGPIETYCEGPPRAGLPPAPPLLVAFEEERHALRTHLEAFAKRGERQSLVIRGALGAGKTALLGQIPELCAAAGLRCSHGSCDELDQHTGFFSLHGVMRKLLGDPRRESDVEWLESTLEAQGAREQLALLNPLLLADFAADPFVQQMTPDARAENRRQLVTSLLKERLASDKVVVVIDDAHWLDASSLELLSCLSAAVPGLLLILAERPPEDGAKPTLAHTHVISIRPLPPQATAALIAEHTGGRSVSEELGRVVSQAARGNPLHCIELVRALVSAGRIEVVDGEARMSAGLPEPVVPATLEEVIRSRFDRLSPATRDVLQAASVIGASFDLPVLREVLRASPDARDLEAALSEAQFLDMIRVHDGPQFAHASMQAVVYRLLLPTQQRDLHGRVARALELIHSEDRERVAGRLAHHFLRAGQAREAAFFSAMAADQALQGYANPDAEHLFRQAIAQDTLYRGPLTRSLERARWSMAMGQALYSQNRQPEARRAFEDALRWSGAPRSAGLPALVLELLRSGAQALWRRFTRGAEPVLDGEARERRILVTRIIVASLPLDVWEGRLATAVSKALAAYRISAPVSDTPEAATSSAGLGLLLATTPARSFAEPLIRRGVTLADRNGDLEARALTRVLLGMTLSLSGRAPEAEGPVRLGQELAERLGAGLWRHRVSFTLGEALFCMGDLAGAEHAFRRSAEIGRLAEPPFEGFANCMAALSAARSGALDRALALALGPRGLPLVQANGFMLQRFTSLGVCAELLARAGRREAALEHARRASELSRKHPDVNVFFAALYGHTGALFAIFAALEAGAKDREAAELAMQAEETLAGLRRFVRSFPAARPTFETLRARLDELTRR